VTQSIKYSISSVASAVATTLAMRCDDDQKRSAASNPRPKMSCSPSGVDVLIICSVFKDGIAELFEETWVSQDLLVEPFEY